MDDLLAALGLALVLEGLIWALAPRTAIRILLQAAEAPEINLRAVGLAVVACGVVLVWLIRG
jgi:hypothetical protein